MNDYLVLGVLLFSSMMGALSFIKFYRFCYISSAVCGVGAFYQIIYICKQTHVFVCLGVFVSRNMFFDMPHVLSSFSPSRL